VRRASLVGLRRSAKSRPRVLCGGQLEWGLDVHGESPTPSAASQLSSRVTQTDALAHHLIRTRLNARTALTACGLLQITSQAFAKIGVNVVALTRANFTEATLRDDALISSYTRCE